MTIETSSSPTPNGYREFIADLKRRVRTTQYRAMRAANTEVLRLYWSVGRDILDRQRNEGWGAKIVDQISADMRREFPGQHGWSRRSLLYMRKVAEAWPTESEFVHQPGAQLPWRHVTVLLDKLDTRDDREWYAAKAVQNGWSRASLEFEIKTDLRKRLGSAPSNFATTLDAVDSDLAQQAVKDSYVFEHLDPDEHVAERDRERVLMDRIQDTLLELGRDMAFVGRQYRIEVGGDEFFVDLLFFHVTQLRYVVVELKVGKFQPAHIGQIGTYVAMVDGEVRDPGLHAKTVGILLCTERNDATLDYALAGTASPVAVALYEGLTPAERAALPSPGELEAVIEEEIHAQGPAMAPAPDQIPV
ncbi:PDDEXK nuclease domain-containing protein [Promicromonospora sukumoe]|uniref:PDDEXK nuclease domain-containing protein n=1 Tax=Promicromonospora sukumoe TaxID=88382 RepID=UPI00039E4909|nr:PDDEXK nuclease domain-containing protein [Promicromonospora sukumoe]